MEHIRKVYGRLDSFFRGYPILKFVISFFSIYVLCLWACQYVNCESHETETFVVNDTIADEYVITEEEIIATEQLVLEVEKWVGRNCKGHQVDIDYLVRACIANEFPVELCVAQAYLECQFGTAVGSEAKSRRTYSMFGIGHWGDGTCKNYYHNWNASVVPYIEFVKNGYIGGEGVPESKRQTYNNLINREFRRWDYKRFRANNPKGGRYANGEYYEYRLRKVLSRFRYESNIHYYAVKAQPNIEVLEPKDMGGYVPRKR